MYRSLSIPDEKVEKNSSLPTEVELTTVKQETEFHSSSAAPSEVVVGINNCATIDSPSSSPPSSSSSTTLGQSPLTATEPPPPKPSTDTYTYRYSPSASRRMVGSDFTVSMLLYLLCSLVGCAYSVIMAFDNYNEGIYVGGLICTFIYTFGVLFTWYGSYPHRLRQNNYAGSQDFADTCLWLYARFCDFKSSSSKKSDDPKQCSFDGDRFDDDDKVASADAVSSNVEEDKLVCRPIAEQEEEKEEEEQKTSDNFGIGSQ
jgi:hypothetical protein